jgi:GNAT superfamily N-acetyltransferase
MTQAIDVFEAADDAEVRACFPVMRVLRPHLADEADFLARVRRQAEAVGWRLLYAVRDGEPVGCASFRIAEFLAWGKTIYVDDLVVIEAARGQGCADALMARVAAIGREHACVTLQLDSGTHRLGAHRFYHRIGLTIASFHFARAL